jgi:hypothetical protein
MRGVKLADKEEAKNIKRDKRSYQGGGINITKEVKLKHTKNGNRLLV